MITKRVRVLLGILLAVALGAVLFANPNQAPAACFTVTPETGTVKTIFLFDAGCSTDDATPPDKLTFRWDWENDRVWDTKPSTEKTASHQYNSEGPRTVLLEVRDEQGLEGIVTHDVVVMPAGKEPPDEPEQ
jgi:PKD repeat protein